MSQSQRATSVARTVGAVLLARIHWADGDYELVEEHTLLTTAGVVLLLLALARIVRR